MPERFRGQLLTMGHYTNPASFTFFTFCLFIMLTDKYFYCRLSPNHKVFHYGDCEENAVPTIEQLSSKCEFLSRSSMYI